MMNITLKPWTTKDANSYIEMMEHVDFTYEDEELRCTDISAAEKDAGGRGLQRRFLQGGVPRRPACGARAGGASTDTPALAYANSVANNPANSLPASSYATVYPLTVFMRIFTAQMMVAAA